MWTLSKFRPVIFQRPSAALRALMVAVAGEPAPGDTARLIVILSTPGIQQQRPSQRMLQLQRRSERIFNLVTGEIRNDGDALSGIRPAEILVVRRPPDPVVPIFGALPEPAEEEIRFYVHTLWDTEERRGQLEVARDEILSSISDEPSITAQLLAIEALPFGHALFTALACHERTWITKPTGPARSARLARRQRG